ncbi:hypothetical protein N7530_004886 [Penicillium desertorum]|uniref:Uncharacterized protein n=1 Tax=Penicillium desertorum TaxID=1303715 RepID=A0A9X0BR69_9EURO|nr:hypothetical protein N7530_004886 [Penicillium desertorum]
MTRSIVAFWAEAVDVVNQLIPEISTSRAQCMYNIYPTRSTDVVYASASAVRNAVMSAGDEEELPRCGGAREWANAFSLPIVVALKKLVKGADLWEDNCN